MYKYSWLPCLYLILEYVMYPINSLSNNLRQLVNNISLNGNVVNPTLKSKLNYP
jgi:hypothetical protein